MGPKPCSEPTPGRTNLCPFSVASVKPSSSSSFKSCRNEHRSQSWVALEPSSGISSTTGAKSVSMRKATILAKSPARKKQDKNTCLWFAVSLCQCERQSFWPNHLPEKKQDKNGCQWFAVCSSNAFSWRRKNDVFFSLRSCKPLTSNQQATLCQNPSYAG